MNFQRHKMEKIYDPKFTAKMMSFFHKIYHSMKHDNKYISAHSAYCLILQLIQFLDNPLFHQIQNTVKLTFSLQSHTTTTTALLTQVSIRAARFCYQKPFSSFILSPEY